MQVIGLLLLLSILFVSSIAQSGKKGDMDAYRKRVGAKYLTEKALEEGITTLKSGMLIEILEPSTKDNAKSPTKGDQCRVTYKGTLHSGEQFDAGTHTFAPNQVIAGWTEAMQYMVEGDKWKLHIPYDLAYGERGAGARIPPYSTLVFEIQIHEVLSGGKDGEQAKQMLEDGTAKNDGNKEL